MYVGLDFHASCVRLTPLIWSQAVAFGMGGGLLQKVNRDTMSFATKLSHVVYADGTLADIMKSPTGDTSKISFPGITSSPIRHALSWKFHTGIPPVSGITCIVCIIF